MDGVFPSNDPTAPTDYAKLPSAQVPSAKLPSAKLPSASLASPYWSRLRDDGLQEDLYYTMSEAPGRYAVSFAIPDMCNPSSDGNMQCSQWHPGSRIVDDNNRLRFGEEFRSYEPGHAVSTELWGRSPFIARGEGILNNIDKDTFLRSEPSDPESIRDRKGPETMDMTSRRIPPLDSYAFSCQPPFEVRVDQGLDEPRGGVSTRVDVRNRQKYVRSS